MKKVTAVIAIILAIFVCFSIFSTSARANVLENDAKIIDTIRSLNIDTQDEHLLAAVGITEYEGLTDIEFNELIKTVQDAGKDVTNK